MRPCYLIAMAAVLVLAGIRPAKAGMIEDVAWQASIDPHLLETPGVVCTTGCEASFEEFYSGPSFASISLDLIAFELDGTLMGGSFLEGDFFSTGAIPEPWQQISAIWNLGIDSTADVVLQTTSVGTVAAR